MYDSSVPLHDCSHISDSKVVEAAAKFSGRVNVRVPLYSAVHVDGKRLYKLARHGVQLPTESLPLREMNIMEFKITDRAKELVSFEMSCSSGTYVRSIAHEIGEYLGVGAHLANLRRTRIGSFDVEGAWIVDDVKKCRDGARAKE